MVWPFGGSQAAPAAATTAAEPAVSSTPVVASTEFSSTPEHENKAAEVPFLPDDLDISKLHPLAGLGKDLDVLELEDDALSDLPGSQGFLPSRGWSDDLCYGSGTMYMGGLAVGGAYGFAEGMRTTPANAPAKIRINAVLNAITRRGPYLGNTAGILAISYNIFNGIFDMSRSYHDIYNSIAAGAITGALYRSTMGVKPMAISALLMGSAMGAWNIATSAL
ncbi:Tim17/Tim22/Tim23/Pmp24 family-domain-containing protein [Myxozyma melibiosi]|uniref:Tim17/Tim22/Tim23/Pmp24 family-domain-containing protein n=1 Tax=Myxozyma melibiosi TaxID=54550 RepID=A0ABR1FC92_9ASCO